MPLFTIKYAPKNTSQVFGQPLALSQLKDFVVNYKKQKNKAALLYGPIGVGKTSAVYALAQELKYDLLELNSSDLRNEANMRIFMDSALGQQSLFFNPKIIVIDEIDNISGVSDRGCISALLKALEKSTFPVILTANEPFESKFKPLQKVSQMIEFHKLEYRTIAHALQWVCEQEGIKVEEKALLSLSRQVDGDLRSALIDLQTVSAKNKELAFSDVSRLSDRKRKESIISALSVIFKSSKVENSLPALENLDIELNEIFLWLDENLPKEYLTASSLAKAYEHLARADVFQGRISRQQHWRFLAYIYNLLTAGISSAKTEKNSGFIKYQPTMRILKIWQAKMKLAKKKEIASKLALATHTSEKIAFEQVTYLKNALKQPALIAELKLTEEEEEWLGK